MRNIIFLVLAVAFIYPSYGSDKQKNGTSTTAIDTLVCGFNTSGLSITNDASSTDTMYVCETAGFSSSKTIIILGGETLTLPLHWDRVVFKFGYSPASGKPYRIRAF